MITAIGCTSLWPPLVGATGDISTGPRGITVKQDSELMHQDGRTMMHVSPGAKIESSQNPKYTGCSDEQYLGGQCPSVFRYWMPEGTAQPIEGKPRYMKPDSNTDIFNAQGDVVGHTPESTFWANKNYGSLRPKKDGLLEYYNMGFLRPKNPGGLGVPSAANSNQNGESSAATHLVPKVQEVEEVVKEVKTAIDQAGGDEKNKVIEERKQDLEEKGIDIKESNFDKDEISVKLGDYRAPMKYNTVTGKLEGPSLDEATRVCNEMRCLIGPLL